MRVICVSVSNHRIEPRDIERTVAAFRKALASAAVT
jgi:hypothetical protein